MSLWSDYVKERLGHEVIETEGGFISFCVSGDDCSIEEFYVKPELRGTSLARRLADQVFSSARERGAKKVWAKVLPGIKGAEHALRTNLHYGFKLILAENGRILLMKEIEGD